MISLAGAVMQDASETDVPAGALPLPTTSLVQSKVRAAYRTQECTAEFEIANFLLACSATTSTYRNKHEFREICSGPIISMGPYQFDIRVVWAVHDDGTLRGDRGLGVYVTRLDRSEGPAVVKLDLKVLNVEASKSVASIGTCFAPLAYGVGRGCSPSFGSGIGLMDLPLSKVMDGSQGFLHQGALRVECTLSVVTGLERSSTTTTTTDTRQEILDALSGLLDSKRDADVTLLVGGERIQAHWLVLAARCPVFAAMRDAPMKESSLREIAISDLEADAVRELVRFFYTGGVGAAALETDDAALALLQAAHRYEVASLVERCTRALVERFAVETVCERLEVADLISCETFKAQCLKFIRTHILEVKETAAYGRLAERRPALLRDLIEVITGPSRKKPRIPTIDVQSD
eukprot:TRINITY_DN64369_c0_g1_i1.p1 TRINITY_DN64369_c0_g1~~TRINITY_DN64369_c0_g1_i1.p1  ORF type:complete len:406 (-),score=114.34 TRINITY_DN64369_c0_g1_i1:351-1568(-)